MSQTQEMPAFLTRGTTIQPESTSMTNPRRNKSAMAETVTHDTNDRGGEEHRIFDLRNRDSRMALERFISWCISNDKEIKIRPLAIKDTD